MKKVRWLTLLALVVAISAMVLVGCAKGGDKVSSVLLKDNDPNTAIEIVLGEFDCSAYTLVVDYESGSTEEIALTEDMIREADIFKLYQVGDHEITINYEGKEYAFKLSVKRASFGELSFPKNNVFTYDGKPHSVEVDGNIPANAVVTYPGGNSFVNAGTYDVTAVVSCDGYLTERLSTTVKIERAKYDMSGVSFEGKEIVYDGNAHSLSISGTLPEGVSSPIYTINGKSASGVTDVGEYKVKATFVSNNQNYEPIPEMEATLTITPAEYILNGVDIVFENENGEAIPEASKVYDGKSVTLDLNDYSKLSQKISVSFTVLDKNGNVISSSNKNTGIVNAGIYTVIAEFTIANSKNYKPIEPIVRTFEVKKASYDTSKIYLDSNVVAYDGSAHRLTLELTDDFDILNAEVIYEYYLDGDLVVSGSGASVSEAGKYTVKAVITVNNENYEPIEAFEATLQIEGDSVSQIEPKPESEPIL